MFSIFSHLSFFFSSRRRHTRWPRDWSSDVCSSDLSGRSTTTSSMTWMWRGSAFCSTATRKPTPSRAKRRQSSDGGWSARRPGGGPAGLRALPGHVRRHRRCAGRQQPRTARPDPAVQWRAHRQLYPAGSVDGSPGRRRGTTAVGGADGAARHRRAAARRHGPVSGPVVDGADPPGGGRRPAVAPHPALDPATAAGAAAARCPGAGPELGPAALWPGLFHPGVGPGQCPPVELGPADAGLWPGHPASGGGGQPGRTGPGELAAQPPLAPLCRRAADCLRPLAAGPAAGRRRPRPPPCWRHRPGRRHLRRPFRPLSHPAPPVLFRPELTCSKCQPAHSGYTRAGPVGNGLPAADARGGSAAGDSEIPPSQGSVAMIDHVMGMVLRPRRQWSLLAGRQPELGRALLYPLVMAALPALAWYYGVTEVGWRVGAGPVVRMTPDSARLIVLLFYLAQVLAVAGVGSMVHWMSSTYGAVSSSPALGIAVAGRAATPLFLAGVVGVYPIFWLDLMLGLLALAYAVYLLYTGIPAMMRGTVGRAVGHHGRHGRHGHAVGVGRGASVHRLRLPAGPGSVAPRPWAQEG